MRQGKKAEVHRTGGSNGPISSRPLPIDLMRREEADSGNGNGAERKLMRPVEDPPDPDSLQTLEQEQAGYKPTLGDVLKQRLRS